MPSSFPALAADTEVQSVNNPHPVVYWWVLVLLALDIYYWGRWVVVNMAAMTEVDYSLIKEEPSLGWLMTFGVASLLVALVLGVYSFRRCRRFLWMFVTVRIAQMLALVGIGLRYEAIAKGLQRYYHVFGPSPMKLALVLMNDAGSSLIYLLLWSLLVVPALLLSLRRPKLYTAS